MSGNKFRPFFVILCDRVDLDKLLPYLQQERMVTNDEYEILTNVAYTKYQLKQKLFTTILPRKGTYYFENSGKCLVWSGQVEIARHIGIDVDSIPPCPYAVSNAGGGGSQANNPEAILHAIQGLISGTGQNSTPLDNPPAYQPPRGGYSAPTTGYRTAQGRLPPTASAAGQQIAHGRQPPTSYLQSVSLASHVPPPRPPVPSEQERPRDSSKVFILYCKDTTLQPYETTSDEFVQDVLELADILVYCGGLQSCSIDLYENDEQPNWNLWTQKKIEESTYVVMVCSPQFFHHLSQRDRSEVQMGRGLFFCDTIVNSIIAPKFVPVFLNRCFPVRHKDWLPPQLHAARYFRLSNLRELFQDIQAQDYSDLERNQVLSQKLQDPKHREVARLVGYLRQEQEVVAPTPPRVPVELPPRSPHNSPIPQRHAMGENRPAFNDTGAVNYIPEATFAKIAGRLPRDWIRLGVKLGVPYADIRLLQARHPSAHMSAALEMFGLWQRLKGNEATKRALKRALLDMNFGRLAVECFNDVTI